MSSLLYRLQARTLYIQEQFISGHRAKWKGKCRWWGWPFLAYFPFLKKKWAYKITMLHMCVRAGTQLTDLKKNWYEYYDNRSYPSVGINIFL
jgi:hypothetical protein